MTCIVAIEENGIILLGGDSAGIADLDISRRSDEKLFMNDNFIIGFCGSFRGGQLLRYSFNPPEKSNKKDDMNYLVTDFMDSVRFTFREKGFITKENEQDVADLEFIVGYNNKIYIVSEDYQVGIPKENYASVGCGSQIALGSLYTTDFLNKTHGLGLDPKTRIDMALHSAEEYSAGVKGPFVFLSSTINENI